MKKTIMGIAAIVLLFSLIGCGDVSVPSPAKAGKLQSYEGTTVSTRDEAYALYRSASSAVWSMQNVTGEAFTTAFELKYGKYDNYYTDQQNNTSYKWDVKIDNNEVFRAEKFKPMFDKVVEGRVKGKVSESFSSNKTLKQYWEGNISTGDNYKMSSSESYDISITNGYAEVGSVKISGFVTYELDSSAEVKIENYLLDYYTGKGSYSESMAVAVSVSDGSKGAKFRWSWGESESGRSRAVEGGWSYKESDIEVYNNNDELIMTLYASDYFDGGGGGWDDDDWYNDIDWSYYY